MRVKWFVMLLVPNISDTLRSSLRNGVLYVLVWVACLLGWCASVGGVDDVLAWVTCLYGLHGWCTSEGGVLA